MRQARILFTLTCVASALPALAADIPLGDGVHAQIDTTLSLGTAYRTEAANPSDYAYLPSTTVPGAAPGQLTGQTGGSDLNFRRGHPVSTLAQGMFDLTVKGQTFGLFARAAAWHDFTLGEASAAYGNYPNGYTSGAPLSDRGLQQGARFNGAMLRDVYVSGNFELGDQRRIELRLGRQVLDWNGNQSILSGNWGGARMISGGINAAINPNDYAAQLRPGALAEESRVPVGMLSLHLVSGKQWGADAFLPYESREAVLPACGTFFDASSVVPPGCNLGSAIPFPFAGTPVSTVAALTERSLSGSGLYVHRYADQVPSGRGQFGLAGHYVFEPVHTEVSAYLMNTPTSLPYFQIKVDDVNGAPVSVHLPGAAGVVFSALQRLNPWVSQLPPALAAAYTPPPAGTGNGLEYGALYPKSVRLYGLSFNTEFSPTARLFGEIAYRPNQPLSNNLNDVLNAFVLRAPNSLLNERRNVLSIPAGGTYDTYDRYGVTSASLGFNKVFLRLLGASQLRLSGEIGLSHVDGLPDPSLMRYGRAFAYGTAPYLDTTTGALSACAQPANGAGLNYAPGKTCTTDGFITPTAWGWRLAVGAVYPGALFGATLAPSLTLADDVHGYSFDGSFSQGRMAVRPALHASWARGYYADIAYTHLSGGRYNPMADRSNLMLAVGVKF
jgi:hypothetical protein